MNDITSKTSTPRTDAVAFSWNEDAPDAVDSHFARQLELELAELRASLKGIASPAEFDRESIRQEARLVLTKVDAMRCNYEKEQK